MVRTKKAYTKQAQSLDDLVARLRNRGVVISDETKAKEYLYDIGYYRLGFYSYAFEVTYPCLDGRRCHEVKSGTTIEDIVALYYYDLDLRTILNRYLSRIEVSIRTTMTQELSMKYQDDPCWFVNSGVMSADFISGFNKEVYSHLRGKPAIKRHHDKYFGVYAPAWKTLEFMTMGNLEVLYSKLIRDADKKLISLRYGEPAISAFKSYLTAIREVRNACAHGNVLYGLHLSSGIITGAACPSIIPGTNQTLNGALRVIDFMIRQISVNRANELKAELIEVTRRLYAKVPAIRPLIEDSTGIIIPPEHGEV